MSKLIDNIQKSDSEILADYCTFRVGGKAKLMLWPKNTEEIVDAISYCENEGMKYIVLGNGSNVLFLDEGFDGVVIELHRNITGIEINGENIYVAAGEFLSSAANKAKENELTGMEFAAGIPGTLGGAIVMNAGAYGGEMKDIVEYVDVIDPDKKLHRYSCEEMQFGYRKSIISDKHIVIGAMLKLKKGNLTDICDRMKELQDARRSKQPLEYPSAGSTFKRPEGHFAGKLIEDSGLKGYRVGGAMVSEKHCGFVINYDHCTASDIIRLMQDVQKIVKEKYDVTLEPEVRIIK